MLTKLLTRDQFREQVFSRDNHTCVFCDLPAVDAHHILERRLWPDGGYYLNNGASVCEQHHIECEQTLITVEAVREACGIEKPIIPPHLYEDQVYDKWGNIIMPDGSRIKGELFHDASVQKIILPQHLKEFTSYVKYPRTHHLPWSLNITSDDRVIHDLTPFVGQRVIVTEKMDGENTTMYSDYFHARSIDSRSHPSRSWAQNFWSGIAQDIPPEWRVCCENLYAEHSIAYTDLVSYVMGFSIWNEKNVCLSWDETLEYFDLLSIVPVPVLYDGIWDEKLIRTLPLNYEKSEGYVVRLADEIAYIDFRKKVAKFVRKGHVMTTKHWMRGKPIVPNQMKKQECK